MRVHARPGYENSAGLRRANMVNGKWVSARVRLCHANEVALLERTVYPRIGPGTSRFERRPKTARRRFDSGPGHRRFGTALRSHRLPYCNKSGPNVFVDKPARLPDSAAQARCPEDHTLPRAGTRHWRAETHVFWGSIAIAIATQDYNSWLIPQDSMAMQLTPVPTISCVRFLG